MPTTETNRRDISTITLSVRSETINEEARTVEAVISTDKPVEMYRWRGFSAYRVFEILRVDGVELPDQVPLLESHARWSLDTVLGSIRGLVADDEAGQIRGTLHFAEGDDAAERAWNKVRQGHLTDLSAGYRILSEERVEPNTSATVKGREYKAESVPVMVATRWQLKEGSLVAIGADSEAKVREHEADQNNINDEGRVAPVPNNEERNQMPDDITPVEEVREQAHDDQAAPPATPSETPNSAPEAERTAPDADTIRREERERVRQIHKLAGEDTPASLVERCINDGLTVEQAGLLILRNERQTADDPVVPMVNRGEVSRADQVRGLTAAVFDIGGMDLANMPGTEQDRERAADQIGSLRVRNFMDLMERAITLEGGSVSGMSDREIISRASTTSALSAVFTNSMNAHAVQAMELAALTTGWCGAKEVRDFKSNQLISLNVTESLQKVRRGGTAVAVGLDDENPAVQLARYGGRIIIDEQDIINDALGLLTELPQELLVEAMQIEADLVYSIILENGNWIDGTALFHSDHDNYGTTSTALAKSTLQAGVGALRAQRRNNKPLNIPPRWLIVPAALEFTAKELLKSTTNTGGTTTVPSYNALGYSGIDPVIEDRLGASGVMDPRTGSVRTGGAAYWMLAGARKTIVRAYRRGTGRRPQVRTYPLSNGQWGMGIDVHHDVGAAAADYRTMYFATGAA
jgi:hypothetical protein